MNKKTFISLFQENHYIVDLKGRTKEAILNELLEPLKQNHVVNNSDLLLETLKKRETLGSTGLGKEVAIPHCRSLAISELVIVVGRSGKGVDWNAIDKKSVRLLFLIVAPPQEKQNIYLPVLGKICEMIRINKIRKKLFKTDNYQDFVRIIEEAL